MRNILLLIFFAGSFLLSKAQKDAADTNVLFKKRTVKYVGIQANLLLQQFVSFNNNTLINTNPYIFSYSKNNVNTGWGFTFGTGLSVNENSTNDGVSSVQVENVNITYRCGIERKYFQNQKLIPFWGADFGLGGVYNKTVSTLNQSFNNGSTTVESSKLFIGPDFRAGLMYAFTKHILVGTEFYFNAQIAFSTTGGAGLDGLSDAVPFNVGFQVPTALFLIFRY
jgi:hypothetical protein